MRRCLLIYSPGQEKSAARVSISDTAPSKHVPLGDLRIIWIRLDPPQGVSPEVPYSEPTFASQVFAPEAAR